MTPRASRGPLTVVSNRLPITVSRGRSGLEVKRSVGGLVSALDPALRSLGGTWVGWPGARLQPGESLELPGAPFRIAPVDMTRSEVQRYYHGFSNGTLWPLFHCMPERSRFERRDWDAYDSVNQRFAASAVEAAGDSDLIWIHDYQLMLAPQYVRRLRPELRVGFFLHIPFPPFDVFRLLPWAREVLRGLLAADLIGFHMNGYVLNFLECVERMLGERADSRSGLVEHGERTVRTGAFPIGIDFAQFDERARAAPRGAAPTQQIVLGVDRLDYTKGIPERIHAFARLLETHPEHRSHVTLLQIAVPSRSQVAEYQDLKREIDELVGRVNGRFASATWSPIRYLYRSVAPERLAALYRDADVALVTPLRDGMNLVAKEYVASQVERPGVLILSRLAGAAETMHEALQVNPYNIDGVAVQLHRALVMDETERESRIQALRRRERAHDLQRWLESFLAAAWDARGRLSPVTGADFESWLGRFLEGRRLALFLDYDGTLTPLRQHPKLAKLLPEMRAALESCLEREDTDVTVVSGRALEDVRKLLPLPGLAFAGNHGLEISGPGLPTFRHEDLAHYEGRLDGLAEALEKLCIPGAWVERKSASLTLHFREVDEAQQESLADDARPEIQRAGFQARDAACALEARPPIGWDKGHAALHVLRTRYGPGWSEHVRPIYVGDDWTDEDAFRALSGLGITFRVGGADRPTLASRTLPNVDSVQALLEWLAERT